MNREFFKAGRALGVVALGLALLIGCASPTTTKDDKKVTTTSIANTMLAQYDFEAVSAGVLSAKAGTNAIAMTLPVGADATVNQLVTGKVGTKALQSGTTNDASQGGVIVGGILNADAKALTVTAWVKATKDWSNFVTIGGVMVDLPNLFVGGGTALAANTWIFPGDTWGPVETGYAWYSLYGNTSDTDLIGWVQVTLVIDPAVGISYYKNGALMLSYPVTNPDMATVAQYLIDNAKSSDVLVGKTNGDPAVTLDDLRFYNYAFTAQQAADLYATYP